MDNWTVSSWLDKILDQQPGTKLFLPCNTQDEANFLSKRFKKRIDRLSKLQPELAASLSAGVVYADHRFWVIVRRHKPEVYTGFVKLPTGEVRKVSLSERERYDKRRNRLMKEDGEEEEQT